MAQYWTFMVFISCYTVLLFTKELSQVHYGRKPLPAELLVDDEQTFLQPFYIEESSKTMQISIKDQAKNPLDVNVNLKHGPASYWYNSVLNGGQKTKDFDYGFKKRTQNQQQQQQQEQETQQDNFSISIKLDECHIKDESYLLVNTLDWEDKIIYDNQEQQQQQQLSSNDSINAERIKYAGWIPSQEHRTLASFQTKVYGKNVDFLNKNTDGLSFVYQS